LFFAEGFMPFLNIPTIYHAALSELKGDKILNEPLTFNNYSLADALIVPVQQLTRYHELVGAIVKATPKDHLDLPSLQRAHMKYKNLGRASNEKMLIAESQEKLETLKFTSSIDPERYFPSDVLLYQGQFTRLVFVEPPKTGP